MSMSGCRRRTTPKNGSSDTPTFSPVAMHRGYDVRRVSRGRQAVLANLTASSSSGDIAWSQDHAAMFLA